MRSSRHPLTSLVRGLLLVLCLGLLAGGSAHADVRADKAAGLSELRKTIRGNGSLIAFHSAALARAVGRSLRTGGAIGAGAGLVDGAYAATTPKQLAARIAIGAAFGTAISYVRTTRREARTETAQRAVELGHMTEARQRELHALDVIEMKP